MCQEAVRKVCIPSESCHVRKGARLLARPLSYEICLPHPYPLRRSCAHWKWSSLACLLLDRFGSPRDQSAGTGGIAGGEEWWLALPILAGTPVMYCQPRVVLAFETSEEGVRVPYL
jgi:hypothetical protein